MGTCSLGPVLQWFNAAAAAAPGGSSGGGDRVCSLSCVDSGSHYADEAGMPYASDGAVLLGKTIKGRLIKLRLDLVSAQPGGQRHRLQGTRGVFEATNANAREGRLSLLPESILDDAPLDTKVLRFPVLLSAPSGDQSPCSLHAAIDLIVPSAPCSPCFGRLGSPRLVDPAPTTCSSDLACEVEAGRISQRISEMTGFHCIYVSVSISDFQLS